MSVTRSLLAVCLSVLTAVASASVPPVAEPHPFEVLSPHGARNDPYYWLRDDSRKDPKVLGYLQAENAYFKAQSAVYAPKTQQLYKELVARLKQDDSTVPYKKGDWLYYTRFEKGREYPVEARKPVAGGAEQILVDGNREAGKQAFYQLAEVEVSPDAQRVAYLEDRSGRRQYTLKVRDIASGKNLKDEISGLSNEVVWANDNKTLFYVENDPVTLLSTKVKKHVLGSDPKTDTVVYTEPDHSFYLTIAKTGDERFITINLASTTTGEIRVIDANQPDAAPRLLAPRAAPIKYEADHMAGNWVIRTDWDAPNYRLMTVADEDMGDRSKWKELLAHNPAVFVEGFALFKRYLAINERSEGLLRLRVLSWDGSQKPTFIDADEPAYVAGFDVNAEQDTDTLRYHYSSLTTPNSVYEVNMRSGERKLLKQQAVLGGFVRDNYVTERVWATARDGVKIPVSLVYRKGFKRDGSAPLYQYAYGSYGHSSDPYFRSSALSLLDRGFVYAIAHIRGGQEMGRDWYESGKLQRKRNTFNDFADVTDYLVAERYAARDKVFAVGGSAGGLLIGAIANQAGDKYRGLVAHVPFVDVVTTMLDESIPLTSNEFDEWGNPKDKAAYDYMLGYSPYDNVSAKAYPAMLVTTGLHDSQVQYFEPAKWVAKLRASKTDRNPLLLKINMQAGHGGKSGRFARQQEVAEEYGFILHLLEKR
ncbi:S9 family peptidase [Chitinimonas sp.]|uniref:S9 family peptidase n=1 Tax=Chitinimonas sp. TaxID=1934313 RepID=UPI0035B20C02